MLTTRAGSDRTTCVACSRPTPGPPTILVLQAGDVHSGAFDPFVESIDALASGEEAWVHVDGAFGLWAAASPHAPSGDRIRSGRLLGHRAHKTLNVPYDCGIAVVRDRAAPGRDGHVR